MLFLMIVLLTLVQVRPKEVMQMKSWLEFSLSLRRDDPLKLTIIDYIHILLNFSFQILPEPKKQTITATLKTTTTKDKTKPASLV